jgi:hypothetical protein
MFNWNPGNLIIKKQEKKDCKNLYPFRIKLQENEPDQQLSIKEGFIQVINSLNAKWGRKKAIMTCTMSSSLSKFNDSKSLEEWTQNVMQKTNEAIEKIENSISALREYEMK